MEKQPPNSVQESKAAAALLRNSALLLFVLASIGGVVLFIIGLIPVCPDGGDECSAFAKEPPIMVSLYGIGLILVWFWIWAFSHAVAARIRLAADLANNG